MREQLVLEAHVERSVRWRCKRLTSLSGDIFRTTVVVTKGIFDLSMSNKSASIPVHSSPQVRPRFSIGIRVTHMHIDNLSITLIPIHNGRDHHQLVLHDKVPYTAFVLAGVTSGGRQVEAQGRSQLRDKRESDQRGDHLSLYYPFERKQFDRDGPEQRGECFNGGRELRVCCRVWDTPLQGGGGMLFRWLPPEFLD